MMATFILGRLTSLFLPEWTRGWPSGFMECYSPAVLHWRPEGLLTSPPTSVGPARQTLPLQHRRSAAGAFSAAGVFIARLSSPSLLSALLLSGAQPARGQRGGPPRSRTWAPCLQLPSPEGLSPACFGWPPVPSSSQGSRFCFVYLPGLNSCSRHGSCSVWLEAAMPRVRPAAGWRTLWAPDGHTHGGVTVG